MNLDKNEKHPPPRDHFRPDAPYRSPFSFTSSKAPPKLTPSTSQLNERLKREGIKTHKERVEELNRYLSNLSEHHDMYVFALFLFFLSFLPPFSFISFFFSDPGLGFGLNLGFGFL